MVVVSSWGEGGMKNYCLMGIKFQFYKMERVTRMTGANDCTILLKYL